MSVEPRDACMEVHENPPAYEESNDVVPELPFGGDSRLNANRRHSNGGNTATVTNISSPDYRNANGSSKLPSIECITNQHPKRDDSGSVPNIEFNLVDGSSGNNNGNAGNNTGNPQSNSVQFQPRRLSTPQENSNSMSINNIFSPIVYSSALMPVMVDPLEENRRQSIAVLKSKVHNHQGGLKRKMTVNEKMRGWMAPADNAANLKLFGGLRAVQEEQHRSMKYGWIIHPFSNLR